MELTEMIIKAHARAHAAELAVSAGDRDAAINELHNLRQLLDQSIEYKDGDG